jgi:hypothetical protein
VWDLVHPPIDRPYRRVVVGSVLEEVAEPEQSEPDPGSRGAERHLLPTGDFSGGQPAEGGSATPPYLCLRQIRARSRTGRRVVANWRSRDDGDTSCTVIQRLFGDFDETVSSAAVARSQIPSNVSQSRNPCGSSPNPNVCLRIRGENGRLDPGDSTTRRGRSSA